MPGAQQMHTRELGAANSSSCCRAAHQQQQLHQRRQHGYALLRTQLGHPRSMTCKNQCHFAAEVGEVPLLLCVNFHSRARLDAYVIPVVHSASCQHTHNVTVSVTQVLPEEAAPCEEGQRPDHCSQRGGLQGCSSMRAVQAAAAAAAIWACSQ